MVVNFRGQGVTVKKFAMKYNVHTCGGGVLTDLT